jgi:hypothetical protein
MSHPAPDEVRIKFTGTNSGYKVWLVNGGVLGWDKFLGQVVPMHVNKRWSAYTPSGTAYSGSFDTRMDAGRFLREKAGL